MSTTSRNKARDRKNNNNNGFSLVELLVVITILGILASIAISSLMGYTERAKKQVCITNCLQIERMYHAYLILENRDH